jgi:CBS-domain-containing membrane protein
MAVRQTPHQLRVRARQTFWEPDRQTFELRAACPESRGLRLDGRTGLLVVVCCVDAGEDVGFAEAAPERPGEAHPSAARTSVEAIMTTRVICVSHRLPLPALERLLTTNGISGAPVVDAEGHVLGMVSKTDLVRHHRDESVSSGEDEDENVVADIMTPLVFSLPPNESIAKAAALMAFEGMHRLPVVNAHREVIGIVSSMDIMRWVARSEGYVLSGPRDGVFPKAEMD